MARGKSSNRVPERALTCDLNQDGAINGTDVKLAVSVAFVTASLTANVEGSHTFTVITVRRVISASLGRP
jgi:hypothetical protein